MKRVTKGRAMAGKRSGKAQGGAADGGGDALTRERIVSRAIELLDVGGVAGLTMRGLAESLGSGVMSLYWHVANKEDVLDLALDAVLAYPTPATSGAEWREDVTHQLLDWRANMLAHPWSAALLPRRALGPNVLARLERISLALSQAGMDDADLNAGIWSLWNYLMGATITRASFGFPDDDKAGRLAHLGQAHATITRSRLLLDNDWDGTFRKGLGFLLDGLVKG